jgi:DNA-binding MarR family transcriptional regulator
MKTELILALAEKFIKAANILNNEQKVARDYGIGFPLNHAEVHLLTIIKEHPDENTSQLAARLSITKGAIAQITKKLLEKGLMTSFHPPENRKEVYFKLTKSGKKVVSGHIRHHNRLNAGFFAYLETLSDKDLKNMLTLLDKAIENYTSWIKS